MIMDNSGECKVCGRKIKPGYDLCIGCERKREKIVNDCLEAGMSYDAAVGRAKVCYPVRREDVLIGKEGRRWVLVNDCWRRQG